MNRFSPQNNFAWALFLLIFAICLNVANVGTESARPNDDAAAQNAGDLTILTPNADVPRIDATDSPDAGTLFERFGESRRVASGRVSASEPSSRSGGTPSTSKILKTSSRVVASGAFGLVFRSFWSSRTVSTPLFLVLLTLRN